MESNVIEYSNIKSVSGYTCVTVGETGRTYYEKYFRYSSDGILWSDYKMLTNKNLSAISVNDNKIYIQYKFKKIGVGKDPSVESISLDVDYVDESESVIPECFWNQTTDAPQIAYSSNGSNLFNPYAVGQSYGIYNQMSTIVSNMFGICVLYFKTEPNTRSRDVVLKEYSIEKVVDKQNIKVNVPDNQLPTRELQFNSMMIDYPVQFEVHIVKSTFQAVFGDGSHPDPHDYMYFSSYMNKMYMVDSVSDPDDFGYVASYWRVSLVPYQESASVKFDDASLLEDTESLIFSAEGKFGEEVEQEFADARKDNQLNDIGDLAEGQDWLRRVLDVNLRIVDEKIYNDWTLISKQHYNLSTVDRGSDCVEYKYAGIGSKDSRMISFAFRPFNADSNVSENILIESVEKGEKGIRLKVKSYDALLAVGNMVKITRVSGLKGWYRIVGANRSGRWIEIDARYSSEIKVLSCGKLVSYEVNECVYAGDGFVITQMPDKMVVTVGGNRYDYVFDEFARFENRWYFCVLGLNRGMSNMWLYKVTGDKEDCHSKIELIGVAANEIGKFSSEGYFGLRGCNLCLTNFRLWSELCEQSLHNLILSQYVVDDTYNTLIVDNAQSELLKNYKWS